MRQLLRIKIEAFSLDSTIVKVHPDGTGALKKRTPAIGKSRGVWTTKIHLVAADARTAITLALSPGNAHDAPCGRQLLEDLGPMPEGLPMIMDKAYEGDETRQLVLDLGMIPVVPPKSNRLDPWQYSHKLYKKRNEIDRAESGPIQVPRGLRLAIEVSREAFLLAARFSVRSNH